MMWFSRKSVIGFILCFIIFFQGVHGVVAYPKTDAAASFPTVLIQWSTEFGATKVGVRFVSHLQDALPQANIVIVNDSVAADPILQDEYPAGSFILGIGSDSPLVKEVLGLNVLDNLFHAVPDSFAIQSSTTITPNSENVTVIVGAGQAPWLAPVNDQTGFARTGDVYVCYEMLQMCGFYFLHPLSPITPSHLILHKNIVTAKIEQPHWPIRGFHYHTEHPLELTNFLQGWGLKSMLDHTGWASMLSEWEMFCEWLVANRQNRIEWNLLIANHWASYGKSNARRDKFREIVRVAHGYGLVVGADIPIVEIQQHAWRMISHVGNPEEEYQQIRETLHWMAEAWFDYISSESGFSEFTHPNCTSMLRWMNQSALYSVNELQMPIFIKVHCSSGQFCDEFEDPVNGGPLNFNFLPYYAVSEMGVYPHTVEFYTFDDPTAFAYGNVNFSSIYKFLGLESGHRPNVYHGETAYWIDYDIDVPLFLPLYGYGRMYDLRKIARREEITRQFMQGQIDFDSGWEWGYWVQDVVTARASWNPMLSIEDEYKALVYYFKEFVTPVMGKNYEEIAMLLSDYVQRQRELLIYGAWDPAHPPKQVDKLNGQAYMEGWDTWTEFPAILGQYDIEPKRLFYDAIRKRPNHSEPNYPHEIRPLLKTMAQDLRSFVDRFDAYTLEIDEKGKSFYAEIVDAVNITALRAEQSYTLYEFVYGLASGSLSSAELSTLNQTAILKTAAAAEVVKRRESAYRVPLSRVGAWGLPNPTAYTYGYLWPAHQQVFWWRDLIKATNETLLNQSPCFLNWQSPLQIALGQVKLTELFGLLRTYLENQGFPATLIADCFAAPIEEPQPGKPYLSELGSF